MTHGFLPKQLFIDHIDGNKLNNSPNNLRPVSNAENIQNQRKAQVTSRLKVLGVSITSSGKYQARIVQNGKSMYLGSFKTIEEAKNSYLKAKREFHVSQ